MHEYSTLSVGGPLWPVAFAGVGGLPRAFRVEGNVDLFGFPGVAVVGSRKCTSSGRQLAGRVARSVVRAGGVVVSGMAAGIDAESHLAASGRTIAVLGQGIASAMPRWQGMLRERILAAGGLVISEFADDQPGSTWSFPRRNRVIAALARATVVVEAAARSGSKITAQHALDLGRDVWAVPGPPDSPTFAGCLDLIEDGAQVVRAVDELGGLILPNGPPLVPTH